MRQKKIKRRILSCIGMTCITLNACGDRDATVNTSRVSLRQSNDHEGPWFENIADQAGLLVKHDSGHRQRYYFPESVCGGGAMFDIDNDGLLDLYLLQCGDINAPPEQRPGNRMYRNLGNRTFEDVTASSNTNDQGYSMGVAVGDYDNDGDNDLYVTNLGANTLYQNDGRGVFSAVTAQAGVGDKGFGASAAFLDFDGDGNLDLFVVNYVHWSPRVEGFCDAPDGGEDYCGPKTFRAPTDDVLYRNNGPPHYTFTDVSRDAGLTDHPGNGLGVICCDFNGDGRIDIFVANDSTRNRLWMNQGDGTFVDKALEYGCAMDEAGIEKAGMGVASADLDGDIDPDLMVVNLFLETDSVFRNEGEYFADTTVKLGLGAISRKHTRFGVGLHDFDNDGVLDLYEANGKVFRVPPFHADDLYGEPNTLMRGTRDGRFEEVTPRGGTAEPLVHTSRAAAFGDFDNDGGIDIFVINRDDKPYLLHNVHQARGHWLQARVLDEHGRDALGAIVLATVGNHRIRRDVRTAYSYCAANDPRVHFGLGEVTRVDEIDVIWPDNKRERFEASEVDRIITLQRGKGTLVASPGFP